jgi:hypothetical protein
MSRKPVFKLLLAVALLVMAWGIGASSPTHAVVYCGMHETDYYSTGGFCNYNCYMVPFCQGSVGGGHVVRIVYHQCYPC